MSKGKWGCVKILAVAILALVIAVAGTIQYKIARVRSVMEMINQPGGHASDIAYVRLTRDDAHAIPRLKLLVELQRTTSLELYGTSDDCLPIVGQLATLETIWLKSPYINGTGLQNLKSLDRLKSLDLIGSSVSDPGICAVSQIKSLRQLSIDGGITNKGVACIASNLPKIERLLIRNASVTDVSVEALVSMKSLKRLSLQGTDISEQGYETLRKRRPDLKLFFELRQTNDRKDQKAPPIRPQA